MIDSMNSHSFFTHDKRFYRRLFSLTLFIALQNLTATLLGLTDNIMLGSYSQQAMSGAGLANQVHFLLQSLVSGIGEGAVVLGSQHHGAGQREPVRRVAAISLRFALATGAVFAAVGMILPEQLLSLYTADADAIREGASYMRIAAPSYILFSCSSVLTATQRCVENVRIGMIAALSAIAVNITLNFLLIPGRLGFPELGVRGSAVATLCCRAAELIVTVIYVFRIDKKLAMKFRELLAVDRSILRDYVKVAVPVMLTGLNWGLAASVQTAILGHADGGGTTIAANAIAGALFQVLTVGISGLTSASNALTAELVGSGEKQRLRPCIRALQAVFLGTGLVTSLALFLLRPAVLEIYAVSAETHAMANRFLLILSATAIGTAYQSPCLNGILRGGGDTRFSLYCDLISMWLIVLPISALAAFVWRLEPALVFICLKSDQIFKCAVSAIRVHSFRWVKKAVPTQS